MNDTKFIENALSVFASNVEKYRIKNNMTRTELADELGVTTSSLSAYVQGRQKPKFDTICRLAEIFEIDVAALFDGVITNSAVERALKDYRIQAAERIFYRVGWEVYRRTDKEIILHKVISDEDIEDFLTGDYAKDVKFMNCDFESFISLANLVEDFVFRNIDNKKLRELNEKLSKK